MRKSSQFKKITVAVLVVLILAGAALSQPVSDINVEVAKLEFGKSTLDDVIRIFGEPEKYLWGSQTFTQDNLPPIYIASYYSNSLRIVMTSGVATEVRFEGSDIGYVYNDKLRLGSSLEEALDVLGEPIDTVEGQPNEYFDRVLYKDIDGREGYCYYARKDYGIRLFFIDYKIKALYLTAPEQGSSSETGKVLKDGMRQKVEVVESVNEFDDVRNKDLSGLDLSKAKRLIRTLQFNRKTIWPPPEKMPASIDPNQLMTDGMNPGLGVRELHRQGITGKGVNVAIIDQPLYQDHSEFAGKIAAYHDVNCGTESSMHGPAVTSLLVGTNCGTAPDARVYYAAAPSWTKDTAYQAQALDWIVEQNERLPVSEKIRIVSVSAAPSGPVTLFEKNQDMWDPACARAEAAGILVLDCTRHHGFIGRCWYNPKVPESVVSCTPGHPKEGVYFSKDKILAPAWGRTIAEESSKGDFGYIYGRGGVSWSIPYCAGVLALGWQLRPDIPPEQMRELLFKSAYIKKDGARIINPARFIRLVKRVKLSEKAREK